MDEMKSQVLSMYRRFGKEALDLHELFEAGGNDPEGRKEVFFAVEQLVEEGLLEERGNDFYALTEEGREAAGRVATGAEPEEGEVGYF
jgi:DNA-binding PadR family transcriptional regulator